MEFEIYILLLKSCTSASLSGGGRVVRGEIINFVMVVTFLQKVCYSEYNYKYKCSCNEIDSK